MAINKRLIKSNDEGGGASFNTVLYTGNQTIRSIGGVGFQPDLVWTKTINVANRHELADVVRGSTKRVFSNVTSAELTDSNAITSFDVDGFSLGTSDNVNWTDKTYVAWCWKAGGAAVTNTDGDITSDVSANVDAGFSVVKWVGSSTSGLDVGHGLSSTPEMIITKNLDSSDSNYNWFTYHKDLGESPEGGFYIQNYLKLNDNTTGDYSGMIFYPINFNASTFIPGYGVQMQGNVIAYCFHSVAGFSKIGSYSGNNSATGPTVTTDFEPAFVMIKRTDSAGNWVILDNKRDTSNPIDKTLNPNLSAEESTANDIDFNATTFQLKSTNADTNASGTDNYIYMAFANQF